ncbi:MAG TPA: M23 family metallopeptidase [Thermoanaerobaculia bacterium]|nr:M23 family metallopeptidase [Thermoanaerobaculia bacterium]
MSEIRFHPGDPKRKTRSVAIGPFLGAAIAAVLVGAGTVTFLGLAGAPYLVLDLVRSVDRLALREATRRGAEAFANVGRRAEKLSRRLAADELFVARVGLMADVPLPPGLPTVLPADAVPPGPDGMEPAIAALRRRLRVLEQFRRRLAALPEEGRPDPLRIPSRSPVDPASAAPLAVFGPRTSELTREEEFFPGLDLAVPAGTLVLSPAAGTVVFSGPPGRKVDSSWRRLGNLVVIAHDDDTRTVFGHLGKALVPRGRRVKRGEPIGRAGQSGFAPAPRLRYEVRKSTDAGFLPVDPRVYILDADWITAAELRNLPPAPRDTALPPLH